MEYTKEQFVLEFRNVAMAIKESRILLEIVELIDGNAISLVGHGADCGIQLICEHFGVPFADYMVTVLCDFVDEDEFWEDRFEEKAAILYDHIVKEITSGNLK